MKILKKIISNPLFKVGSHNSLNVGIRVITGLASSKIIAFFLGPAGIAIIDNLRNFLSSLDVVSTLGFQNGIIKYVAENEKDTIKLNRVLATIFITLFCFCLALSIVLFFLSDYFSELLFGSGFNYNTIFKLLAFLLPLYVGNAVFLYVINGLGKFRQVININIIGNIIGFLLSALLIWNFKIEGALYALLLAPVLLFFFSGYSFYTNFPDFHFLNKKYYDFSILKGLSSYTAMSLVTAVLSPLIYIAIRTNIIEQYSMEEAGFWGAINRVSGFYLMFVSTLFTVYFLPKLSVAKTNNETKQIFWSYYKSIIPVFIIGLILIYLLRAWVIQLLFTKDFFPVENLFFWQLLGDLFKVCALILGYEFFAKKMTKVFIITEIFSFLILYFSSIFLIEQYGSEGAVMAHAFTYSIYLIVLMVYFRKKLF